MIKIKLLFLASITSFTFYAQTYITNVTVADVEQQQLIANQTVIIKNEHITAIKPSNRVKIAKKSIVIDGTGKYLFPGMTDAHIHFFQNGGLYARPDVIDFRKHQPYNQEIASTHELMETRLNRYLKNGITNVIDVGATYNFLEKRSTFKGRKDVPSVFMTGPLLTTYKPAVYNDLDKNTPFSLVTTVEEAKQMVQEQLPYQPDFIKIWYIASLGGTDAATGAKKYLPIVKAVIDEAHQHNLKVAVHATERITAQLAVENGCDFLVHSVNDEIISDDFVQLLKKKQVILSPTLVVHGNYAKTLGQTLDFDQHELIQADPFQLGSLLDLKHLPDSLLIKQYQNYFKSENAIAKAKQTDDICAKNLKKLADAEVLIASGTDAGNIGTLHASSYLSELQAMKQNGMSNWNIIQASTINGAKILNKEALFGSISKGKQANMILLNANPIEDITQLSNIHRVINKGQIFDPKNLVKDTPEILAQRQLNAYNLRDIEAFLEPYADDVEIYSYPDILRSKGKDIMRKQYGAMFKNTPNLHCELKGRTVEGNIVTDKERVQFGERIVEATAIYHIENGKIKKVFFKH